MARVKYCSAPSMRCTETSSEVRSTAISRNSSGPISFWPPSPRLFCTSMTRRPMPYPKSVKSALVSSSGCAGACRNVPETLSLRSARPRATWPPFCDTREKLMRFCAWSWTYPGPTVMNMRPRMPTLNARVSGNLRKGREFLLRLRGIGASYTILLERMEGVVLLFHLSCNEKNVVHRPVPVLETQTHRHQRLPRIAGTGNLAEGGRVDGGAGIPPVRVIRNVGCLEPEFRRHSFLDVELANDVAIVDRLAWAEDVVTAGISARTDRLLSEGRWRKIELARPVQARINRRAHDLRGHGTGSAIGIGGGRSHREICSGQVAEDAAELPAAQNRRGDSSIVQQGVALSERQLINVVDDNRVPRIQAVRAIGLAVIRGIQESAVFRGGVHPPGECISEGHVEALGPLFSGVHLERIVAAVHAISANGGGGGTTVLEVLNFGGRPGAGEPLIEIIGVGIVSPLITNPTRIDHQTGCDLLLQCEVPAIYLGEVHMRRHVVKRLIRRRREDAVGGNREILNRHQAVVGGGDCVLAGGAQRLVVNHRILVIQRASGPAEALFPITDRIADAKRGLAAQAVSDAHAGSPVTRLGVDAIAEADTAVAGDYKRVVGRFVIGRATRILHFYSLIEVKAKAEIDSQFRRHLVGVLDIAVIVALPHGGTQYNLRTGGLGGIAQQKRGEGIHCRPVRAQRRAAIA